jgi:hypothetical protein
MYAGSVEFHSPNVVYVRAIYYKAADIKSHRELERLERWFHGAGIRGIFTLRKAAIRGLGHGVGAGGRPREYAFIEIIISTPKGARIDLDEARRFSLFMVATLMSTGAMVGGHWHKDGRFDMHILLVNDTIFGAALGTAATIPQTGKKFRNVEVVARWISDLAHEELNKTRRETGRPEISTMEETRASLKAKRLKLERQCKNELAAESTVWSKYIKTIEDSAGSVTDPGTAASVPPDKSAENPKADVLILNETAGSPASEKQIGALDEPVRSVTDQCVDAVPSEGSSEAVGGKGNKETPQGPFRPDPPSYNDPKQQPSAAKDTETQSTKIRWEAIVGALCGVIVTHQLDEKASEAFELDRDRKLRLKAAVAAQLEIDRIESERAQELEATLIALNENIESGLNWIGEARDHDPEHIHDR